MLERRSLLDDPNGPAVHCEKGGGRKSSYHYDSAYRELVNLPSGLDVIFRAVHPDDKQLIAEGMARLSPASKHARFLTDKASLSGPELAYLTEFDGHNHFAIGVVRPFPGGGEVGIGVARFVRLKDNPEVAEPAVTVIDEYQGCGLGTALLRRLVDAARERGIKRFRCEFLADNQRVRTILDEFKDHALVNREQGEVTMEVPLPSFRPDERPRVTLKRSAMYRALVRAAQGLLSLRRVHERDGSRGPVGTEGSICDLPDAGADGTELWETPERFNKWQSDFDES